MKKKVEDAKIMTVFLETTDLLVFVHSYVVMYMKSVIFVTFSESQYDHHFVMVQ